MVFNYRNLNITDTIPFGVSFAKFGVVGAANLGREWDSKTVLLYCPTLLLKKGGAYMTLALLKVLARGGSVQSGETHDDGGFYLPAGLL